MSAANIIQTAGLCSAVLLASATAFLLAWHARKEVKHKMNAIIQALAEVQTTVDAITAQVDKARAEIIGRISDLEAAIASADPAGIQAAVDALKSSVGTLTIASQAIDDIVTDAVTPPSEPPPVPTP